MALGRLGDPADGDCLMVEALFPPDKADPGPAGAVAGILSFVPWGSDGYSLDVMRRSPRADNGVTEVMVSALMAAGRELGVRRVSLNFAVFRSAFEEGARIGAGPVRAAVPARLLLVASRWWQIESLFRSNVKYRPGVAAPVPLLSPRRRDIALVGAGLRRGRGIHRPARLPAAAADAAGAAARGRGPGADRSTGDRVGAAGAGADAAADGRPATSCSRPAATRTRPRSDRLRPAPHSGWASRSPPPAG